MLQLYKAFIFPHFYYCSIWHFCGKRNTDKMEALNKRILKFILKDNDSNYSQLLEKAGTATLTCHNAYLTQENVKMTCHFCPSCVPGTHGKISWHVVKGDGEKTMSQLTHGPLHTQLFFSHVTCWQASRVH